MGIGLVIIVISAFTLGQSPTPAQPLGFMFLGGAMAYTGVVMCTVAISDYYDRKTTNKMGNV